MLEVVDTLFASLHQPKLLTILPYLLIKWKSNIFTKKLTRDNVLQNYVQKFCLSNHCFYKIVKNADKAVENVAKKVNVRTEIVIETPEEQRCVEMSFRRS